MKKIRDGQTIIGMLEGGELASSLGTEITETLAKLKELAGDRPKNVVKGSVTLKVELKVENGAVEIECTLDSKRPKPSRPRSFYWVMDDGSLSTEHPQQTDMFAGPREARRTEPA
jgi:hypothetical protein